MPEFLATIAEQARQALEQKRRRVPRSALEDLPLFHAPRRGCAAALGAARRHVIAEVKRASPSRGLIREAFDAPEIARDYASCGASAISVVTEEQFFGGSLNHLARIREVVELPLLRKDFILDSYQLAEARSFGADAVLLIAALLDPSLLKELRHEAYALGLDVLVEVHTERELNAALDAGAQLIGINNRDLKTFEVSLATTEKLAPKIPDGTCAVCESGIDTVEQIRQVEQWGIRVFLIGEALMRSPRPGAKLAELLSA
ncbi:MAG TPA: indole-3-glycerol phosphate synthase TrpC [Candidatus Eisenbacteria bacterium]|nr:indole-3-glycerol phosphate synthase TrpC [Candidatus Eisenbacteria bacterium]